MSTCDWRCYYLATSDAKIVHHRRGSTDESPGGYPNVLSLPRGAYDAIERSAFVSAFARALLTRYDTVIYTDCDEIVVPDLSKYSGLGDYLARNSRDFVTCIGLNVVHILSDDAPIDVSQPILAQRRYAVFRSPTCKPAVTRIPLRWTPGFHACDHPHVFDPDLYLFHLPLMDYGLAVERHRLNAAVPHPDGPAGNMGAHWRYPMSQFVRESFLDPMNALQSRGVGPFDFTAEIEGITGGAFLKDGYWHSPMNIVKLVEIPEHLRAAF